MGNSAPKKSVGIKRKPISDVVEKKTSSVLALAPIRSLLIRIEPRVPMVVQQLGLAILLVGIGTLSASLYLQSSVPSVLSQAAQIYGTATVSPTSTPTTTLPPPIIIPKVDFSFPSNLTSVHPVTIKVTAGSKMQAFIQSKTSGLETPLKNKSASPSTGTWVFEVDVQGLPAGEYRFLARTYENNVWYDDTSNPFIIQAPPVPITQTSDQSGTSGTASSTSGTNSYVIFGTMPAQLSGQQAIILQVTNVQSIKIGLKARDGKLVDELSPSSVSGTSYTFKLDTRKYPDGQYTFEAKFYTASNVEYVSGPTTEFVNGTTINPVVTTSSTTLVNTSGTTTVVANNFSIKNITNDSNSRYQTFEFIGNDLIFVEVHTKSQAQTLPVFSGLAVKQPDQTWRYTIDISTLPKGKYQIVAKYKRFETVSSYVGPTFEVAFEEPKTVSDPDVVPAIIEESVGLIKPVVEEVQATVAKIPVPAPVLPERAPLDIVDESVPSVEQPVTKNSTIENNQDQIDDVINQYTAALRSGSQDSIDRARNRALSLGVELEFDKNSVGSGVNKGEISSYLEDLINRADRIEVMVKERTQDKISQDTDQDGITDYDEVALYKTDPTRPDTDNDGFNDGAEVLAGFNPTNSESEVAVVYESPKDAGIARPDVLEVQSVVAISETVPKEDGVPAQAQISGKGLPNSFVTLFVFSTPVVVTLKTADDGSWMYTFDKELEDGEHEVYVGVTDNAGVIVAKSNPFRFIKEAQAFTPADELADSFTEEPAPRGIQSSLWQAAIFGLIVFIVGLILILLGQQLEHTKKAKIISES